MSPTSGTLRLRLSKGQLLVKGLSPRKAKKILEDGSVRGNKLTGKQVKFFHVIASGKKLRKK